MFDIKNLNDTFFMELDQEEILQIKDLSLDDNC